MAQVVHSVERGTGRPVRRHWRWVVDSHGSEARTNGVTTETDGRSRTTYVGTNDVGRPYHRRIVTKHGQVVSNRGS
ncbi:MAG: hypothetical protein INR66_26295 [Gordonia polyisoprenivorans]|nr:hypothetical protein [Gordonia polyisoprenivorans]